MVFQTIGLEDLTFFHDIFDDETDELRNTTIEIGWFSRKQLMSSPLPLGLIIRRRISSRLRG